MIKPIRKVSPIYFIVDLILIWVTFSSAYFIRYHQFIDFSQARLPYRQEYFFVFILWAIFIIVFFKRRSLYATDRSLSIPREIFRVALSVFYSGVLINSVIFFGKFNIFSRQVFMHSFIGLIVVLSAWRLIKRLILRRMIAQGYHNINALIIGAGRVGKVVLEETKKTPWWGIKVRGFLDDNVKGQVQGVDVIGVLDDFEVVARKYFIDEVIVTIPSEKEAVAKLIKEVKKMNLGLRIVPEGFEESAPVLSISYLGVVPVITYKERRHHPAEFALKRAIDLIASGLALLILSPLFLLIAVFIKLDSKGPVFYVHKRAGYKGRPFSFYKFRSMVHGADKLKSQLLEQNEIKDGVIFKMKNDPRVTRAGRFLRKFSLDELPQLVNVFKGDMSLVGPRPPTPDEVEKYTHEHMPRLSIRPGITGLSQVRGRSDLTFKKWVRWDLWYVNNWTFGLDFLILWWTVPAVLKAKGAY